MGISAAQPKGTRPQDVVAEVYAAIGRRDWPALHARLHPRVSWFIPAAPMPTRGLRGPGEVVAFLRAMPPGVEDVRIHPGSVLPSARLVIVLGHHELVFADGTERLPFRHSWHIERGRVLGFREALNLDRLPIVFGRRGLRA